MEDDTSPRVGLDHDYETQTDHAQFRQYSHNQGRWLSPDPYYGSYDFSNPQSLNRYAYAGNNPLSFIDPSGLDFTYYCLNQNSQPSVCVVGINDPGQCTDFPGECDPGDVPPPPVNSGGVGSGGGVSSAPSNASKVNKVLQCASKTANVFSIAGVLGITGEGGGIGSTIGTAFLGNTFSGIVDTGTHIYNNATIGGNGNQVMGDLILGGARQGLPGGGLFSAGVVGLATGAGVNAVAEGMAGPVGWAKLAIDEAIFAGSVAYCNNHP